MLHFISTSHILSHLNTFLFLLTAVVFPTIPDSFNTLCCSSPGMPWEAMGVTVCSPVGGTLRGLGVVDAGRGYTRFSLSPGNVYISGHHTFVAACLIDS